MGDRNEDMNAMAAEWKRDRTELRDKLIDLHASTLGGILEAVAEALGEDHPQANDLIGVIEGALPEHAARIESLICELDGEPDWDLCRLRWDRGRAVMERLQAERGAGG